MIKRQGPAAYWANGRYSWGEPGGGRGGTMLSVGEAPVLLALLALQTWAVATSVCPAAFRWWSLETRGRQIGFSVTWKTRWGPSNQLSLKHWEMAGPFSFCSPSRVSAHFACHLSVGSWESLEWMYKGLMKSRVDMYDWHGHSHV